MSQYYSEKKGAIEADASPHSMAVLALKAYAPFL